VVTSGHRGSPCGSPAIETMVLNCEVGFLSI